MDFANDQPESTDRPIPLLYYGENLYQHQVMAGATERDQWLVCYDFTNLCQRFTGKLLQLDPQLAHPASVAFVQVLDFFCKVPFDRQPFHQTIPLDFPEGSEDATKQAAADKKEYDAAVPIHLLQGVVAQLTTAAKTRDAKFSLPAHYRRGNQIPSWNPLQCYLQVVMDHHFGQVLQTTDFTKMESLKPILRTYLQENETNDPKWYTAGMPSCLFLYQVPPKSKIKEDQLRFLKPYHKPRQVLVFTSDCTWGCLVGLKQWSRQSRLITVPRFYRESVERSTASIRDMYNGSLLNFDGEPHHAVTIQDDEKRKILIRRFKVPDHALGSREQTNDFLCPKIKPIFEMAKGNYGTHHTGLTRGTWCPPAPYDMGKAQAFWLPFWGHNDVRTRCPRCRVLFQFDMVDESDGAVDWLETVYPGTPWSCAEVMAMFELQGVESVIAGEDWDDENPWFV